MTVISTGFERYIGIDYSGAATPRTPLAGLRVFVADGDGSPREVRPVDGRATHWSRRGVASWLRERLQESERTIVGIDHGFSFPIDYFERHGLDHDWAVFLDDFCAHWPTARDAVRVEDVRRGVVGEGATRDGSSRWRRCAERLAGAKSVFHFDVPGSVAKSTMAGLPWLRWLRESVGERLHAWPFDGLVVRRERHVIAEAYPSLWRSDHPQPAGVSWTGDQHDASVIAASLRDGDRDGRLARWLDPEFDDETAALASFEGWILGLAGP